MSRFPSNAWVEVDIEGRGTDSLALDSGTRTKEGGMTAMFFVRDKGKLVKSVQVYTYVDGNDLYLRVLNPERKLVYEHKTER